MREREWLWYLRRIHCRRINTRLYNEAAKSAGVARIDYPCSHNISHWEAAAVARLVCGCLVPGLVVSEGDFISIVLIDTSLWHSAGDGDAINNWKEFEITRGSISIRLGVKFSHLLHSITPYMCLMEYLTNLPSNGFELLPSPLEVTIFLVSNSLRLVIQFQFVCNFLCNTTCWRWWRWWCWCWETYVNERHGVGGGVVEKEND